MDRRTFIGGSLLAVGLVARAQVATIPTVGFLSTGSAATFASYVAAFRQGLNEVGYVDGKNVAIEFRWAEGQYERLESLAADLVRRRVAVLVTTGGTRPAKAAAAATSTIPIVFTTGSDPVEFGLIDSMAHPGGNATGVTFSSLDLVAKRVEILHLLVPKANRIALISGVGHYEPRRNAGNKRPDLEVAKVQEVTRSFDQQLHVLTVGTAQDIDVAFTKLMHLRADAVIIGTDPFFNARREQLVALTARHAIPAIFDRREFVAAGGLISYGGSIPDAYRVAGVYTGKILNGTKPGDLPAVRSSKIELFINLMTAKALGITVPESLLLRADEVIH